MASFGGWFQKKTESANRYSDQLKDLRKKVSAEDRVRFKRLREESGLWLTTEDRKQAQLMTLRDIEAWLGMKPAEREAWFARVDAYLRERDASWNRYQQEESRPSDEPAVDHARLVNDLRHAAEILGVAVDADKAEIRRAFRNASKQHHPDLGGDVRQFTAIQSAYDILMSR
ncbi:Dna-J like membrane chaperone protein [compost metagenome]